MNLTACPHCGAKLPLAVDAFCSACRGDLSEPPVASVVTVRDSPTESVAARPTGIPFGRIFGGLGMLVGVASGARSLGRIGGVEQVVREDPFYLFGYLSGSAVVSGLIGLVLGVILGHFVRSVRRPKNRV